MRIKVWASKRHSSEFESDVISSKAMNYHNYFIVLQVSLAGSRFHLFSYTGRKTLYGGHIRCDRYFQIHITETVEEIK